MNKSEFNQAFLSALEEAAIYAESSLGRRIPRNFVIELHGAGTSGAQMSPEDALDALFIDERRFYRIIDVAVIEVAPNQTTVFVRASGHQPAPLEQTWGGASGPFKQIQAEEIRLITS